MSVAEEVFALRNSAGFMRASHVAIVRVDGADALDFLQKASTQSPYVREGRVRHTLLLRDDATIFADAFIVNVDDGFLILAEGASEEEIVAWLSTLKERSTSTKVDIHPMSTQWVALAVDGPYAWEVVSAAFGPVILGLPYLALLRREDVLCLRAGKTGEYGYLLVVPPASADEIEKQLFEVGASLDLARVSLEALDVCALENWHFSMRNVHRTDFVSTLTPIELQLQWRVVYGREFAGSAALEARHAEGAKARVTCFTADGPIARGARVRLADREVGEVLVARESPTLARTVGSVLLETRFAHPHLTLDANGASLRTCTASLVLNQSLRVQPHKHAYATRGAG